MDLEDATDTSTDSQIVLAIEFNNQATLHQEEGVDTGKLLDNAVANNWEEELLDRRHFSSPIPLPYYSSIFSEGEDEFAHQMVRRSQTGKESEPTECLNRGFEDLKDVTAEAGVCGLHNLGNTCFMATGIQCLMATPSLVHCLLHQPVDKDSLTSHLAQLTLKMWSGQYSAVHPKDFKHTLGTYYHQFKDFNQHDCQEFLALLLDGLHEQMNSSTLQNKNQKINETDCDTEICLKTSLNKVPSGLCKNISPYQNNFKITLKCGNEEKDSVQLKNDKICTINNSNTVSVRPLNNSSKRLSGFGDIIKDAKTSNVNVLVTEQEPNNEIKFDSDKFPKSEKVRQRETFNFNSFHLFENNVSTGKRGKSKVTHYKSEVDFREGLDLKRLKVQRNEQTQEDNDSDLNMDCDWEKNHRMEDERKHRVSNKSLDKNYRMECERRRRDGPGPSCAPEVRTDQEAEAHWQKHLEAHRSVIVDTFQGQFKSTVVCSKCRHVSVTYEPFMYLSVPLPNAMQRQFSVIFVSAKSAEPVQYLLTVNKHDTVRVISEQILSLVGKPVVSIVVAEVLDHHIAKILDENLQVRFINNVNRQLYAFELANFSHFSGEDSLGKNNQMVGCEDEMGESCTICLEEKDSDMSRHVGCSCILCDPCIARTSQHYGFQCPVCRELLVPGKNLVSVDVAFDAKPSVRLINASLVCRLDMEGDGNNNTKTMRLVGHPQLLRLPNRLQGRQLHEAVASLIPYTQPYKILLVDGQGHHCSRCMFNAHCRGCPVDVADSILLKTGDTLAAMFVEPVPEVAPVQHSSMLHATANNHLTLYDCVQAFSQSEMLDDNNPWYCPSCQDHQCATKTLSVWRYPNCLIIYLKRFVFQDHVSTKIDDKVTFPLCGLKLSSQCSSLYNLYACVCHVGGVYAGHYTAYAQHLRTGEWHHFDDDTVTNRTPQEDDYSNAYILFYKKQGGGDMKNEDFNAKLFSYDSRNLS